MLQATDDQAPLRALIRRRTKVVGTCWEWQGALNYGYGVTGVPGAGRNARTHRLAYEVFVGKIPDGLVLDHLCRNRKCCNPSHLEPVTDRVNILRGEAPNIRTAREGRCKRGHARTAENINKDRACRPCKNQLQRERYHSGA